MNDDSRVRPEAVPVVYDGRRYNMRDTVYVDHIFRAHHGGLHFYHPADEPMELQHGETSAETLAMSKKQARSLRDQLIGMDLGDNDEKGK
jgi:hypothetical protein